MKAGIVAALLVLVATAEAVILYRTGDPTANTTEPTGIGYAASGWQYEGFWGPVLGTPITPRFFLSAAHVGNAGGSIFVFQNIAYRVTREFYDPAGDLSLFEVSEEFPMHAPVYSGRAEADQRIIAIGRGTQRGNLVELNGVPQGWLYGTDDFVMRWGENIISAIVPYGTNNQLLAAAFDQTGLPQECHLSFWDSGGAAFLDDLGTWKLAGIHFSVDGPFYPSPGPGGSFYAALFDTSGYYQYDGSMYVEASGASHFYSTRISSRLAWIGSHVAQPRAELSANGPAITYTKLIVPSSDLVYAVQKSSDLGTWEPAMTSDEVLSTKGNTQRVRSTVIGASGILSLRVEVRRP